MKAKRLLAFLCVAAVLQGLVLLFCTEAGLMKLYPLLVRASEEEYQTMGAYTVYYDMRMDVSDAPVVAVGMDFEIAQSYDAFQHLFRFLKQYLNITDIYLWRYGEYADAIAQRMEDPLLNPGLSAVLMEFADTLTAINDTQPPVKKCTVHAMQESVYMDMEPGRVLYLMDRDEMMEKRDTLESSGVLCIEMKYVNCTAAEGIRHDIPLPFTGEEVRYSFLPASRIEWFYRYFERVTNLLGDGNVFGLPTALEQISAPYVICIANGQAADLEPAA
ncbi:MAG: hypothetical protein II979_12150 [Clostridia bacterium]|nr:hypothetical protein [Clostridia bacterium]